MNRAHSTALSSDPEYKKFQAFVEKTPEEATIKGMYIDSLLQQVTRRGIEPPTTQRFFNFKDYPMRDFMRMLLATCPLLYPDLSLREGLIQQGRMVYPTLISSIVGKVVFTVARDFQTALPLASRGYEVSIKPGSAKLERKGDRSAVIALRDVYSFADSYQVGVFEGAMEVFQVDGTVKAYPLKRFCDVDLHLEWT